MRTKVNIRFLLLSFLSLVLGAAIIQFVAPPAYETILGDLASKTRLLYIGMGILLAICGLGTVSAYTFGKSNRASTGSLAPIIVGGVLTTFFILTRCAEAHWKWLDVIEHAARLSAPWLLLAALRRGSSSSAGSAEALHLGVKIVIALTFIGHGLYALGWPEPIPANFLEMVKNTIGLEGDAARRVLGIAGLLDLLAAVGIFLAPAQRVSLFYMVGWGFLTAIARPWAYFGSEEIPSPLLRYLPEALVRAPHFLLPLFLLSKTRTMRGGGRLDISGL